MHGVVEPQMVTQEQGRAWERTLVPWWLPRLVFPLGWFVVMIVMLSTGSDAPCRDDPSGCTDLSAVEAVVASTLLAIPVLLWLVPVAGLLLGVAWGGLWPSLGDPDRYPALGAFSLACLILLVLMLADWQRTRPFASDPLPVPQSPARPHLRPPASLWIAPLIGAGVALALAGAAVALYAAIARSQHEHLDRSIVLPGEVTAVPAGEAYEDGDWIEVRVQDYGTFEFTTDDTYALGETVEVRVDPDDLSWGELADEPTRFSFVMSPVGPLLLVAGVWLGRLLGFRRFLGRVRSGHVREHAVLTGQQARDVYLHGYPGAGAGLGRAFAVLPVSGTVTALGPGAVGSGTGGSGPAVAAAAVAAGPVGTPPWNREPRGPVWGSPSGPTPPVPPWGTGPATPPPPPAVLIPGVFAGDLAPVGWGVVIVGGVVRWPRRPVRGVRRSPGNRADRPTFSRHTAPWAPPRR